MQRSFRRDLGSLEPLFEFTEDFATRQGLDEAATFAMSLAVEELFTNMVKYGGGGREVSVELDVRDGDLVIELVHPGAVAFDVTKADEVEVAQPLNAREPGGLGLHLVKSVMDGVDYEYRDRCARVTLTRRLGGS